MQPRNNFLASLCTGLCKRNGAKFRELSSNFPKLADWLCMGWQIYLAAHGREFLNRGYFFCSSLYTYGIYVVGFYAVTAYFSRVAISSARACAISRNPSFDFFAISVYCIPTMYIQKKCPSCIICWKSKYFRRYGSNR